jgi:prepilin-type N-terminal cleavage/methylation domain-containing protein
MKARGFTLIELVVAIAISAIVLVFATMFIGAPLGAYETHSRRAALVADTSGAWPRMEADLRLALPNSLRASRNGNYVTIEMLKVIDVARYVPPISTAFIASGVTAATPMPPYLAVNPSADVYALNGSMTPVATMNIVATATPGEYTVTVDRAPAPAADSPKGRIFFVGPPVTYLCDEGQGTLRRYTNYPLAANHAARDTPGELAGPGVSNELITRGLTSCNVLVSAVSGTQVQTAAVRLSTTRSGDTIALMHTSRAEYLP